MKTMKTGIIDVGGGFRGVYAAGVLDYCLDNNLTFDLGIGISAGSANIVAFAAKQRERNRKFYTEYALRKEYISVANLIEKHALVDMEYASSTLSNDDGECPLDYPTLRDNPMDIVVVATDAQRAVPHYFSKDDISQNNYEICRASGSIPYVCSHCELDGVTYLDGAISDPVPIAKAFSLGCDKVVLVLTRPIDGHLTDIPEEALAFHIRKTNPVLAEALRHRTEKYNAGVALAKMYQQEGKVLIVAPSDTCGVDTLKRDKQALELLYEKGYEDGTKITDFIAQR